MTTPRITVAMKDLLIRINDRQPVYSSEADTAAACISACLVKFDSTEHYHYSLTVTGSVIMGEYRTHKTAQKAKRAAYSRARNRAMNETARSLGLVRTRSGAWE